MMKNLMVTIFASGRAEAALLKTDYEQLSGFMQRKNVALAGGLGKDHKEIKTMNANIIEIEKRIARSVELIRKKLERDLAVLAKDVDKLESDANKQVSKLMVSAEEKTRFGIVREDYERELAILDAIKQAEFTETLGRGLERDPIMFHKIGWTTEVAAEMKLPE